MKQNWICNKSNYLGNFWFKKIINKNNCFKIFKVILEETESFIDFNNFIFFQSDSLGKVRVKSLGKFNYSGTKFHYFNDSLSI